MRTETVTVPDGSFEQKVWLPESGHGPGILLIQEIYGVGEYITDVAEDLAGLGYVVAAPDLFWRLQPNWRAPHTEEGTRDSMGMVSRFDFATGLDDLYAAFEHLQGLPETDGVPGTLGFCFGGTMAYLLAVRQGPSVVLSFYGSGVIDQLDGMGEIGVPIQFHFGGSDPYIPREKVATVEEAVRDRPNAEIHVQEDAGHAFHNHASAMFHVPDAAERAWETAKGFLARHLPTSKNKG
ncbi:dienelactone hydrolase family protein [Actinomadura barringtoniae]|uniref:Dienelactone hydrolase family protein n=1 Tax=Actinomadura barringtoniae TaxID=1427535 RepID=A0A939PIY9_9ACTN|nr:dienelactone hydrolase family protein [Actinomadura barringtoniae]MBO2453510.1 dienelactone hydrolase family protein [Actinomadura barringtoniae]